MVMMMMAVMVLVRHVTQDNGLTDDRGVFLVVQLERFSLPMFYFFRMECRRWAPMRRVAGSFSTP
jgi:hypothetical protein